MLKLYQSAVKHKKIFYNAKNISIFWEILS